MYPLLPTHTHTHLPARHRCPTTKPEARQIRNKAAAKKGSKKKNQVVQNISSSKFSEKKKRTRTRKTQSLNIALYPTPKGGMKDKSARRGKCGVESTTASCGVTLAQPHHALSAGRDYLYLQLSSTFSATKPPAVILSIWHKIKTNSPFFTHLLLIPGIDSIFASSLSWPLHHMLGYSTSVIPHHRPRHSRLSHAQGSWAFNVTTPSSTRH